MVSLPLCECCCMLRQVIGTLSPAELCFRLPISFSAADCLQSPAADFCNCCRLVLYTGLFRQCSPICRFVSATFIGSQHIAAVAAPFVPLMAHCRCLSAAGLCWHTAGRLPLPAVVFHRRAVCSYAAIYLCAVSVLLANSQWLSCLAVLFQLIC